MMTKYINTNCFPDDDVIQKITVRNTLYTFEQSDINDRFSCFYSEWHTDYYRKVELDFSNNKFEDIHKASIGPFVVLTTQLSEIIFRNNSYYNVNSYYGIMEMSRAKKATLQDITYENSTIMSLQNFRLLDINEIVLQDISIRNINYTANEERKYIYIRINDGGNINVDNLSFSDLNFGTYRSLSIEGDVNLFHVCNVNYTRVLVGSDNSLMEIGSFHSLNISDIYLDYTTNESPDDIDSKVMAIQGIDLDIFQNSSISNIYMSNSEIGLIKFDTISGNPSGSAMEFILSNINYYESSIKQDIDLISFTHLESDQDITFIIEN